MYTDDETTSCKHFIVELCSSWYCVYIHKLFVRTRAGDISPLVNKHLTVEITFSGSSNFMPSHQWFPNCGTRNVGDTLEPFRSWTADVKLIGFFLNQGFESMISELFNSSDKSSKMALVILHLWCHVCSWFFFLPKKFVSKNTKRKFYYDL